jgi:hypothetical protein
LETVMALRSSKGFDAAMNKFHKSLGAIESAADRAKDSPPIETSPYYVTPSPSVAIRHDR